MDRESRLRLMQQAVQEYLEAQQNNNWISLGKLSKKYGFKRDTISKYIKLAGGTVENHTSGKSFNYKIFDEIDTEEKAYWLGFLYADGCVTNNYSVEFGIIASDIEDMQKYRKFLGLNDEKAVSISNNVCRVRVYNKHLAESLIAKGVIPNKSLVLTFPDEIIFKDLSLIRHFIRGYFDGDGSLGIYTNKNGNSVCELSFVGTKSFLEKVMNKFKAKGYLYPYNNVYRLSYSCKNARLVANYLYQNANIYLNRKFNLYREFCRFEEQSSNAKSSKIGEVCDDNPEVISEIAKGSETL